MWGPWWNDIDRRKPKESEKNLSQCPFIHHTSHWIDLGTNLGHCGERPATNHLSHGTANAKLKTNISETHSVYISRVMTEMEQVIKMLVLIWH
jgi:hypothetical protein